MSVNKEFIQRVFPFQYSSVVDLNECLELFTQEEILDGEEKPVSAQITVTIAI